MEGANGTTPRAVPPLLADVEVSNLPGFDVTPTPSPRHPDAATPSPRHQDAAAPSPRPQPSPKKASRPGVSGAPTYTYLPPRLRSSSSRAAVRSRRTWRYRTDDHLRVLARG